MIIINERHTPRGALLPSQRSPFLVSYSERASTQAPLPFLPARSINLLEPRALWASLLSPVSSIALREACLGPIQPDLLTHYAGNRPRFSLTKQPSIWHMNTLVTSRDSVEAPDLRCQLPLQVVSCPCFAVIKQDKHKRPQDPRLCPFSYTDIVRASQYYYHVPSQVGAGLPDETHHCHEIHYQGIWSFPRYWCPSRTHEQTLQLHPVSFHTSGLWSWPKISLGSSGYTFFLQGIKSHHQDLQWLCKGSSNISKVEVSNLHIANRCSTINVICDC